MNQKVNFTCLGLVSMALALTVIVTPAFALSLLPSALMSTRRTESIELTAHKEKSIDLTAKFIEEEDSLPLTSNRKGCANKALILGEPSSYPM